MVSLCWSLYLEAGYKLIFRRNYTKVSFINLFLVKLKVFAKPIFANSFIIIAFACNQKQLPKKDYVLLRVDTINVVKLNSSLMFAQSTCRGCANQYIPNYSIKDSLGLIQLMRINNTDENSNNEVGGSADRSLEFKAIKTGKTILYVYKSYLSRDTINDKNETFKIAIEVIK
jgi:predicted secreted protein